MAAARAGQVGQGRATCSGIGATFSGGWEGQSEGKRRAACLHMARGRASATRSSFLALASQLRACCACCVSVLLAGWWTRSTCACRRCSAACSWREQASCPLSSLLGGWAHRRRDHLSASSTATQPPRCAAARALPSAPPRSQRPTDRASVAPPPWREPTSRTGWDDDDGDYSALLAQPRLAVGQRGRETCLDDALPRSSASGVC